MAIPRLSNAVVTIAATTTKEIIASPGTGYFTRILGYYVKGGGVVNVTLKNGTVALAGSFPLAAYTDAGYCSPAGVFDLSDATAFNITTDGAAQVSGHVSYSTLPSG